MTHFYSESKPSAQYSLVLLCLSTLMMFMLSTNALAEVTSNQTKKTYNVPAGSLDSALNRFAQQAGIAISFNADQVQGLNTSGLQGSYSVDEGLSKLLADSNLISESTAAGYTVKAIDGDGALVLGTISIDTDAATESAYGPVDGYVAKRSATGTKTDTPLIETPRSISVVTADQIADQDIETISEALRYTAGVMTEARGLDKTRPFIGIRGFYHRDATLVFRDGMLGSPFSSLLHPNIDLYGLERLELLRGPGSVLYGQVAPGGMVVTVTKRPTEDFFAELEGSAGSYDQFAGKFDVGGPIDENKNHLFRLTGLLSGGDSQIDFLEDDKMFIAPAYTWKPNNSTSFTILSHYQEVDTYESTSLPAAVVGVLPNVNGKVPISRFGGEPGHQFNNSEESAIGYVFEKEFNNRFTLNHRLRYEQGELDHSGTGLNALQADNRTVTRIGFTNVVDMDSLVTDTNLQFDFNTELTTHKFLLGIDYRDGHHNQFGTCCFTVPSIDIYNPVYGQGYNPGAIQYNNDTDVTQTGLYIQDQINFNENWIVNLGLRHDQADSDNTDNFTGVVTKRDDDATTFQGGLVYLFDNGFAPYFSYAESFQPQSGTNFAGSPFEPTTGEQYELGIKYQPENSNTLITAAIYQITRQNITTPDRAHNGFNIQTGEVESRGFEVEAKTNVLNNIDLIASYSYTDTEVTGSNDTNLGKEFPEIPDHLASVWADYNFYGAYTGLVIGSGVRHVGKSFGNDANTFSAPDRTLVDATIRYQFQRDGKGPNLKFNISNLFDKYYVTSCSFGRCYLGGERTAKLSVGYRW